MRWFVRLQLRLLTLLLYPFVWWQLRKTPGWKHYSDEWKKERVRDILHIDEIKAELLRRNSR